MPATCWKPCQISKMMRHIENAGIVISLFRHIQGHSAIFSRFQAHWGALRHIQALMRHIEPYSPIFKTLCNPCIYKHTILRTLRHLEPKTSSIACQIYKAIRHTQSPGMLSKVYSSIFKDTEGYSGILMHIQPHSEACN